MRNWLTDRERLFSITVRFSIILLTIKTIELLYVYIFTDQGNNAFFNSLMGYGVDLSYLFSATLIFLLLSFILGRKSIKKLILIYEILIIFLIFFYNLMIIYFLGTGTALDQVVYIHSLSEIKLTLLKSIDSPFLILSAALIFNGLFIFGAMTLTRKLHLPSKIIITTFIISVLAPIFLIFTPPKQGYFINEFHYLLAANKEAYFIASSFNYWKNNDTNQYSQMNFDDLKTFRTDLGPFTFAKDSFPFLHIDNQPDILGKYFKTDSVKPNFVFIACESLSRAFSGKDAYFGSFTPFLDSLEDHSLYWENCLSSTERTFGVLPALLGALPYGRKGFAALAESGFPNHLTLLSLLKKNGYYTTYYHGGPLGFDFLYDFIKYQQPDFIFNEPKEGPIINEPENKEVSWGLYDNVLFEKSIKIMKHQAVSSPRFDIFLTLTTHAPFNIPNREYWEKQFDKRLKSLHLPKEQRKRALAQKYRLSAFMYLDHSLQQLIYDYKKNFDFNHTIFLITGDHRMGTPARNDLEKYHVPLIIYSPMLKSHEKFSSIVNHLAVPATINSFLKHNYDYQSPDSVSWVMQGLDTNKAFRNIYSYPTMRNSRIIEEYIYKEYYLIKDQLYIIKPGIELQSIDNDSIKRLIYQKLKRYHKYNNYACYNNKLFPYTILPQKKANNKLVDNHWKNTIFINPSTEYISILHNYHFDMEKIKGFKMKINFDVNTLNSNSDSLPIIVFNIITKNKEQDIWKALRMRGADGDMAPTKMTTHITLSQDIDFERYNFDDGMYLKVFFWNNKKINCRIINMHLELIAY